MGRVGKPLRQHGGIGNENFWFESKEKGSGRRKKTGLKASWNRL